MNNVTILPERSAVPVEQTWDLESIFPDEQSWQKAYDEAEAMLSEIAPFKGKLGNNSHILAECFQIAEKIRRKSERVYVYASLKNAENTLNQNSAAKLEQARSLQAQVQAATSFIDPELISIGFDKLKGWVRDYPELNYLGYYINKLEDLKEHLRSTEVEEVIAQASNALASSAFTYRALTNAELRFRDARDSQGNTMDVGQSSIDAMLTHSDREVRRTAWESYADGYLDFKSTLANTLVGAVKRDVFFMRTRGYSSSMASALGANRVPTEIFHNLISVFKKNLPTWQKYWQVRRRALGYKSLNVYDTASPLTLEKPFVSYKQSVEWIVEGMKPLGETYVKALRAGSLEERWVDHAVNKGKSQGAFSSGVYDTSPYILMSYSDDLFSLSTLAHELGHSMHSYFANRSQPYIYSDYSIFVAEVASNFNQAMVRDYLFRTQSDKNFQIALIEEAMANYHRYFFIMPTLARFELELHERVERGAPINADILIKLTADLFKEGYGEEVVFDHDRIGITWAQFGHMYMNFYVYQYATGISASNALVKAVLDGDPDAPGRYLDFLKAGGSMDPLDAVKLAGVDMTSPEPVEEAFGVMADLVDRLERLTG